MSDIDEDDFLGRGTGESTEDPPAVEASTETVVTPKTRKAKTAAPEEERLHPILTNEEVRLAQAAARTKVEDARRKAAMKAVEATERARLEREEGLITGEAYKDELVSFTVDLAAHSSCILLNMQPYWHGHTYEVPRHVANTLAEMQSRGWKHQDEIDGQSLTQHYQKKRLTQMHGVTGAVRNAAVRPDAEVRH